MIIRDCPKGLEHRICLPIRKVVEPTGNRVLGDIHGQQSGCWRNLHVLKVYIWETYIFKAHALNIYAYKVYAGNVYIDKAYAYKVHTYWIHDIWI
jgi:hypothetical protein